MATSKEELTYKLTFRMFEDGDHQWGNLGDKIFNEDTSHKCPTYVHRTPPCQGSCPSVKTFAVGYKLCAVLKSHRLKICRCKNMLSYVRLMQIHFHP